MKTFSSKLFFMSKTRYERCPHCGSLKVKKWGRQRGHQRYKCKQSGGMFTFRRKDVGKTNRFVWFEWWILRKQTVPQIAGLSGYSERQLYRWFDEYLENSPQWRIQRREKVNLLIDGTWFPNKLCLVVYRDERVKATLLYRLTDNEWEEEITEDIENLKSVGVEIESVTSDGGRSIIKAVRKACPNAIRQRCLAHIQRECLIWITKHPQSEAGIELSEIVCMISLIKTHNDRRQWISDFNVWTEKYKDYLDQKTIKEESHREWYTHKMVRRAYIHIKKALPDMFYYLDNPRIPKTTNALESFFGHLKENVSLHRGMSYRHCQNYLKWYLYLTYVTNYFWQHYQFNCLIINYFSSMEEVISVRGLPTLVFPETLFPCLSAWQTASL